MTLILESVCYDKANWKEIKNSEILPYLYEYLGEQKSTTLDQNFPSYLVWGDRKHRKKLIYSNSEVVVQLLVQELYDVQSHPTVGFGEFPITVEILAPNQRVVQRTKNILAFWESSYPDIKKDLSGRYPKHEWR